MGNEGLKGRLRETRREKLKRLSRAAHFPYSRAHANDMGNSAALAPLRNTDSSAHHMAIPAPRE